MSVKNRIILACQELVTGDKFASSMYALLTGERVTDYIYIEDKIQNSPNKALVLLSKLEEIVKDDMSNVESKAMPAIINLRNVVNYRGVIVILSGPSASGKDQLIIECRDILEGKGISTDIVRKYSTRSRRSGEVMLNNNDVEGAHLDKTSYYTLGEKWFEDGSDDLFFIYEKYLHKYAFSKESIHSGYSVDVQFIVFGDVANYKKFLNSLQKQTHRKIISFLIDADEDTLHRRQKARDYLTPSEKDIRITEMRKDLKLVQNDHIRDAYDVCIPNGRDDSISTAETIIVGEIEKYIKKGIVN